MEANRRLDRFTGAMLGFAVGDALGSQGEKVRPLTFAEGPFGTGAITACTQQMVAQAVTEFGRFEEGHLKFRLGKWMKNSDEGVKAAREALEHTAEACRRLYRGESPAASSSPCCDAAARALPIGLMRLDNPRMVIEESRGQAAVTHRDSRAEAGACAFALCAASVLMAGGDLDPVRMIAETAELIHGVNREMAERLGELPALLEGAGGGYHSTGNPCASEEAVPAALFSFFRSPGNFSGAVEDALKGEKCASYTAAMAGSLAGAYKGVEGIPRELREKVEGRKYLENLGFRLYTLSPAFRSTTRAPV